MDVTSPEAELIGPLQTVPNAGLPAGFRKKTPNGDARMGAGIMFVTPDSKALFVRRAPGDGRDHVGEWCFPAGRVEEDEEPADAARRESMEEIGHLAAWDLAPLHRETHDNIDFTTFGQPVDKPFDPVLNEEHNDHKWADLSDPPQPLHPGVARLLKKFFAEEASEPAHRSGTARALEKIAATDSAMKLALDESVRTFDEDGRMFVSVTPISKAIVNPYKGSEIPDYEALGLEADKVYQLLRDPEELAKAAPTFNGIQLLKKHVPVDADDHQMWDIVGCTGTDARFDGTYLTNSLSVWTTEAIDFIESDERRELSCGYHYDPDMTPGEFQGVRFDGVMRNIRGNHVALVEEGRAGHDVLVNDSFEEMQWALLENALANFILGKKR